MNQTAESATGLTPLSQAEFDTALRAHELWMRTGGQEGRRGNFRDMDLRNCSLGGANLVGASLRGSCLQGMDLSRVVLQEVDMAEAILSGVKAKGANFQRANLSNAKLDSAVLEEADFSFANLQAADLSGASLDHAILVQTSLREAQLSSAALEKANLSQAIFRGANLTDANLAGANLEHADLRDTKCMRTRFDGANLRETMLRGADMEGVSFIEVDFSHAVDVSPQYQMVAFQQRQEALLEEKRRLAQDREKLAERETAVLNGKRDIELKNGLFNSLKEEEEKLCTQLSTYASWAKMYALIWFLAVAVIGGGIGLMAANIPMDKLNIIEISVLFGSLLAIMLLFVFSAILPRRAAKLLEKHVLLRERKQSLPYTETMEQSDTATYAEPKKSRLKPRFGGKEMATEDALPVGAAQNT